jgi:polyphosphate kinase
VRPLLQNFELTENAVYRIDGPVNLNRVIQVYDLVQRPDLKYPPMTPRRARRRRHVRDRRAATCCCTTLRVVHAVLELIRRPRRSQRAGDQADAVPHRQGFGSSMR